MEITLNFVSGHSICHMVIKNDDQSVVKKDNDCIRGMIFAVKHLVEVSEA